MKKLLEKEFIRYCFIGCIGGVIEVAAFYLLNDILNINYVISNVISFFLSVIFLYYFNTYYVFKREFINKKIKIRKFNVFLFTRILGLVFDTAVLALCISVIGLPSLISKIISCSSSAIINYYVGKVFIFK
jgi:putative flippase GtrA